VQAGDKKPQMSRLWCILAGARDGLIPWAGLQKAVFISMASNAVSLPA
jgi:hypothetical protein